MHLKKLARLVLFAAIALGTLPGLASADVIMNLSQIYNGITPAGSAPWARATFTDIGANTVRLTMKNLATDSPTQFISNWTFNIGDTSFLSGLKFTYQLLESSDWNEATSIDLKADKVKGAGGGNLGFGFDIGFDFSTANGNSRRFMQGETCVYDIKYTGAHDGFQASLFDALTDNGLLTSIHLQGIPVPSGGTTSTAATVPEPSSIVLWSLLGIAGLGLLNKGVRPLFGQEGSR
jgi:hypothetical protein